jgi:hypothetical protein
LEFLCNYKLKEGFKSVSFAGETYWDWKSEPRGLFNIIVSASFKEKKVFYSALFESIKLFNLILTLGNYQKASLDYSYGLSHRLVFFSGASS